MSLFNRLIDFILLSLATSRWAPHDTGDRWVMRRRVSGAWEYRECTADEVRELEWWHAIK